MEPNASFTISNHHLFYLVLFSQQNDRLWCSANFIQYWNRNAPLQPIDALSVFYFLFLVLSAPPLYHKIIIHSVRNVHRYSKGIGVWGHLLTFKVALRSLFSFVDQEEKFFFILCLLNAPNELYLISLLWFSLMLNMLLNYTFALKLNLIYQFFSPAIFPQRYVM